MGTTETIGHIERELGRSETSRVTTVRGIREGADGGLRTYALEVFAEPAFLRRQVVPTLEVHPEVRRGVIEEPGEPQGGVRADRPFPAHDLAHPDRGHPYFLGESILGQVPRPHKGLQQHFARMHWLLLSCQRCPP